MMIKIPGYRDYQGLGDKDLNFRALVGDSGVANIDGDSTINSTTVSAALYAVGGNATASEWPLGGCDCTLALAGSGSAPTIGYPSLGNGSSDYAVYGNAGKYYQDAGTTVGNVNSDDVKIRLIGFATGTTSVIAAKRNAGVGWEVGINASDQLYCTIQDSGGSVTVPSAALQANTINDAVLYLDRSGSGQWYVNNAASGSPVVISGTSLSLDNTESFTLLADSNGASPTDFGLVYFGLWHSS